ncbi:hypothetical protein D3C76_976170 [compost metagenome]
MADLRGQFGVGAGLPAQFGQLVEQFAVAVAEGGDARRVFAVQQGAVGQRQAHAGEGVVGVLRGAAAHAAGVVGDDAADLAGVDRGRIGADLAAERRQPGVGLGADDAGLQADLRTLVADVAAVPGVAEDDQHRIADGLPGEAGAGGAEGHRHALGVGGLEQCSDFVFALDTHHQLGNQPVEAGVGAEGEGGQRIVEATVAGDQVFYGIDECGGQAHYGSSHHRCVGRWAAHRVLVIRSRQARAFR